MMKKMHEPNLGENPSSYRTFATYFLSFLLFPGALYLLLIMTSWVLSKQFLPFINTFLSVICFCIVSFFALFIIPLRAYQHRFISPASWEETLFSNNWLYIDIAYLTVLAFSLAFFLKKKRMLYSWGIYLLTLTATRILMHVLLRIIGFEAYYDLP